MKKVFDVIVEILRSKSDLAALANACESAYCANAGYPFTTIDENDHDGVGRNQSGIIAVKNGIASIVAGRLGRVPTPEEVDEAAPELLKAIANGLDLPEHEAYSVMAHANSGWCGGTVLRQDKGPQGRLLKMNIFHRLPMEEVDKDAVQVITAAEYIREKLASAS